MKPSQTDFIGQPITSIGPSHLSWPAVESRSGTAKKGETVDILALNMPLSKLKSYLGELEASKWSSARLLAREVETAILLQGGKPPLHDSVCESSAPAPRDEV